MDLFELILGNFLGFGFALVIYALSQWILNNKAKKKETIKQKNFLELIKEEIEFNKEAMKILSEFDLEKVTPARLKCENKNGCWIKVIEYRHKNPELINQISHLYFLFNVVNKILDLVPYYFSDFQDTSRYFLKINESIQLASQQCISLSEKVIEIIDKEIIRK